MPILVAPAERLPLVTVVIPCRNEAASIGGILETIVHGTYPIEHLEVFVVDGGSTDRTREIVEEFSRRYPFIRVLGNPKKNAAAGMNIGIRAGKGEFIVRMDGHAEYPKNYIQQLIGYLASTGADNVGGVLTTHAADSTAAARAVALILSHPFGVGGSSFRIGVSEPTEVDTVPFGCYRRDVFDRIGLYDERFIRNQDDELNARLKKTGGRIMLLPDIHIGYFARKSLSAMNRMLYQYGYFKPLVAHKLGAPATLRQLAPPIFVITLITALPLLAHTAANVCVSARLAARHGWKLLPYLVAGFLTAHISYGFGYLKGICEIALTGSLVQRQLDTNR